MTHFAPEVTVNEHNPWRLQTLRDGGWRHSARPGAAKKYFMASANSHANEAATHWLDRHDRPPRAITKDEVQWRVCEGYRPDRLRLSTLEGEDTAESKAGADLLGRLGDQAVINRAAVQWRQLTTGMR